MVTFTYLDPEHRHLDTYLAHLRSYKPLFRTLPSFQFLYVSTASGLQSQAAQFFSFLVEGKGLTDLTRYFDLQTKWDNEQYGRLTEVDVLFLSDARKRFTGPSIESLYYLWKRNRLPSDFEVKATDASLSAQRQRIIFRTVTMPGHEAFSAIARRTGVTAGRYEVVQGPVHFAVHLPVHGKVFRERQIT